MIRRILKDYLIEPAPTRGRRVPWSAFLAAHCKAIAADSVVSPIVDGASIVLLAPNAGPALVPSILPVTAVAQALASLMVTTGGAATLGEIGRSDAQLQRLHAYADRYARGAASLPPQIAHMIHEFMHKEHL